MTRQSRRLESKSRLVVLCNLDLRRGPCQSVIELRLIDGAARGRVNLVSLSPDLLHFFHIRLVDLLKSESFDQSRFANS